MKRRSSAIEVAVLAAVAAAAQSGCYWPVPSCSEGRATIDVQKDVNHSGFAADGTFVIDGRPYRSCEEICRAADGVKEVHGCHGPEPVHSQYSIGAIGYKTTCDVELVSCEQPTIVDMGSGRRFEGLEEGGGGHGPGAMLAEMARIEAASVIAFERLARELEAHGADVSLVARAWAAAADEVRHARMLGALAKRHGVTPSAVAPRALPVRSLEQVARENAIEGCVGETMGAVLARVQSEDATDARVRAAMRVIAIDEARHAAFAWDVHAWAMRRLPPTERRSVAAALRSSLARLVALDAGESSPTLGLPERTRLRSIAREAQARLVPLACAIDRGARSRRRRAARRRSSPTPSLVPSDPSHRRGSRR